MSVSAKIEVGGDITESIARELADAAWSDLASLDWNEPIISSPDEAYNAIAEAAKNGSTVTFYRDDARHALARFYRLEDVAKTYGVCWQRTIECEATADFTPGKVYYNGLYESDIRQDRQLKPISGLPDQPLKPL